MEDLPVEENGEEEVLGSSLTMEKVAAAKQFIENHYRAQMKNIQERKERYLGVSFFFLFVIIIIIVFFFSCLAVGKYEGEYFELRILKISVVRVLTLGYFLTKITGLARLINCFSVFLCFVS